MTFVHRTLTVGNYAFTAIALIFTLITLGMWATALLAWGDPGPYTSALAWTFLTILTYTAVALIEYINTWGG